jgi:hypothetical protein
MAQRKHEAAPPIDLREYAEASSAFLLLNVKSYGGTPRPYGVCCTEVLIVVTADFCSYKCRGFYPIAARDLGHAALLFATWKARRQFGPLAGCTLLALREEISNGARFEVRLSNPVRDAGRPTISL